MNGNVEDIEGLYVSEVWDFLLRDDDDDDDDDDMYINPLYVEKREMKRKRLTISTWCSSAKRENISFLFTYSQVRVSQIYPSGNVRIAGVCRTYMKAESYVWRWS